MFRTHVSVEGDRGTFLADKTQLSPRDAVEVAFTFAQHLLRICLISGR